MPVDPNPKRGVPLPLETVLKSLADPVRLSIVRQLLSCNSEKACGCFQYEVTKQTFSHHLAVLEESGIVQGRADGTRRLISLRRAELERDYPGLLALIGNSS